jgi:uncharacterized membrane protein
MPAFPPLAGSLPASPLLHFPLDAVGSLQVLLRWVHFLAGITWVGLGYFFVLAGAPWQAELDPATRRRAAPPLLNRALWWFRWSSVAAVVAGLWLWMTEVGTDRRAAGESGGTAIWSFFVLWTLAYIIYMGVLMAPAPAFRRGPVLALTTAALVMGASYAYLRINHHGWETNRMLAIGLGGGIGWFMMFNVWGIVWRCQKRLIHWTAEGVSSPQAANLAQLSTLAARTNAWLSLPMLFLMAVASHYPMFGMMT